MDFQHLARHARCSWRERMCRKLSSSSVLALSAILLAGASCSDSQTTGEPGSTTGGTTSSVVGTGGGSGVLVGNGGSTSPLVGTGGGPGAGTGGIVGKGGAVSTGTRRATGGAVGTGGTHATTGAGGAATGGVSGKGGSTGSSTQPDAGTGGACACTGNTTTLECFCSRWSCPSGLSAFSTDGGAGFAFVTMEEFADCDLVQVNGLSPGLNPDQWVFERSTGRLVGARYASDVPEPCPWDRDAGGARTLFAGQFPETTCVRTRCVPGTLPQVLRSCPDGGV
jgi:hypothetical protein